MSPFTQSLVASLIGSVIGSLAGGCLTFIVARFMYRREVADLRRQRELDNLTELIVKANLAYTDQSYGNEFFADMIVLLGRLHPGHFKDSIRECAEKYDWAGVGQFGDIYRSALLREHGVSEDRIVPIPPNIEGSSRIGDTQGRDVES